MKDLSLLNRDLSQTIIVDNSPMSYIFHPGFWLQNVVNCCVLWCSAVVLCAVLWSSSNSVLHCRVALFSVIYCLFHCPVYFIVQCTSVQHNNISKLVHQTAPLPDTPYNSLTHNFILNRECDRLWFLHRRPEWHRAVAISWLLVGHKVVWWRQIPLQVRSSHTWDQIRWDEIRSDETK